MSSTTLLPPPLSIRMAMCNLSHWYGERVVLKYFALFPVEQYLKELLKWNPSFKLSWKTGYVNILVTNNFKNPNFHIDFPNSKKEALKIFLSNRGGPTQGDLTQKGLPGLTMPGLWEKPLKNIRNRGCHAEGVLIQTSDPRKGFPCLLCRDPKSATQAYYAV